MLTFLILDGPFSINSNLQLLMEDARKMFGTVFTNTFDSLMDKVISPIFKQRFSKRISLSGSRTKEDQRLLSFKTKGDCIKLGPRCSVILNRFINTIHRLSNIFFVLNIEHKESAPVLHNWKRNVGTLLANINYLLDDKYERRWKYIRDQSSKEENWDKNSKMANVAKVNMHDELTDLFNDMIPDQNISLPDMLGLLGFADGERTEETMEKELKYSLPGFDPLFHKPKSNCNLHYYFQSWVQYRGRIDIFSTDYGKRRQFGEYYSNVNQLFSVLHLNV